MSERIVIHGERALWQEVLLRAIMDARLEPDTPPIPANAHNDTVDARRYLTTPSKDLAMVCALAGVDMQALIERMQRQVAAVQPAPAYQHRHKKHNATFTHDGRTLTVREWAEVTGVRQGTIYSRLRRGMSIGEALHMGHSTESLDSAA